MPMHKDHKGPMKKKATGPDMPASHKHMTPAEHEAAMKKMKAKRK